MKVVGGSLLVQQKRLCLQALKVDDFVQAAHLPSRLGFCANTQTSTPSVVHPAVVTSAIQDNAPADSSQTVAVLSLMTHAYFLINMLLDTLLIFFVGHHLIICQT